MYFAHDAESNFFYYGEEPPSSHIYNKYLVDSPPQCISMDVETISLKERIALGMGISVSPTISFYFPMFPKESSAIPWNLLKNPHTVKALHNGVFDMGCLTEYNINMDIMDTAIMSRLLCNKFNSLIDLSYIHGMEVHETPVLLKEHGVKTMLEIPRDTIAKHCMQHSAATFKLYMELLPRSDIPYLLAEMVTIPIMVQMETRGIKLDQVARQQLEDQLTFEVDQYRELCEETEMFNPASPQQVSYILAKRGAYGIFPRLPFTRGLNGRRTNSLSTSKETLEKMDDPLATLILKYRERSKLLSTYILPWKGEERAYTRYHLDAATGRPSSTDRNMQNLPGAKSLGGVNVRACCLPDSGTWTDGDFSQTELRTLAHISQDREMLHIYSLPELLPDGTKNEAADIHQATANFLNIDRKIAKNVNFAMVYGGTDQTIAETAHIRSVQRAGELREMWFALFPGAADWIHTVQRDALTRGIATTVFGRKMRLPTQDEEAVDAIQRKAVNYPIQGTAADILKRALVICKDMDLALQIHDEILIDGIELPEKFHALESIAPFKTPFSINYFERWE